MAEDTVYISDLDPILELAPTDSFVVETLEGTNRILFRDFILGPDNVSFYEEVAANTIAIFSLSSDVLNLDADVTNINSGLTGLSAAYDETIKNGFCYLSLDDTGTLVVIASSSNIQSVITTDATSRVQITTTSPIDFTKATINVTLNDPVSSTAISEDFVIFTPVIDDRNTSTFKVGAAAVLNHFLTLTLPTTVTATSQTISPVTSLTSSSVPIAPVVSLTTTTASVLLNPTGNGNVINSVTANTTAQNIVTGVTPNTTPVSVVTNVTTAETEFDLMVSTNQGNGGSLRNLIFNISFRYV
jgi:hypothetical protein